ncbi:MAG TPA: BatA and WFA domain-containing protein [Vicinamibacterales bacterium]|nr:BatA and WFA domain-containing protein [Vicinamibacterales bacterium]
MAFLTPLFLIASAAIGIPIFVHLIQREKSRVVEFPSLMFVQKIPYQSVRRRRIRHWGLLAMRCAALLLIVMAFARPFLRREVAAAAALGGSREVVILLDHSASMGYGDHWQNAKAAARRVVASLGPTDKATLVLFDRNAEESMRATSDRPRLDAAIDAAAVDADSTRFGPALKLAESILLRSTARRREAVLVSDFQRAGWSGSEDVHFPDGYTVTPVSVATPDAQNLAVPSVTFSRQSFANEERVTVTAGVANRGSMPQDVPVSLDVEGRPIQSQQVHVGPRAAASVTFTQFTLDKPIVKGTVRAGNDQLPADNTFHFTVSPGAPVSILVVESPDRDSSLYLTKALGVSTAPVFQTDVMPVTRVSPSNFEKRAVVVLNDVAFPPAAANGALTQYVRRGGGLLIAAGEHTTWPQGEKELLPGTLGMTVDRTSGRGATLGFLDHGHFIFEIFKAPRSGDFSAAQIYKYRRIDPAPGDKVLARFDDGAPAAIERKVGAGRVIVWASALDASYSDLPLKPVYLPLVHQIVKYLAQFETPHEWQTVGAVVDVQSLTKSRANWVVVTPAGKRVAQNGPLELDEQGVYEVRPAAGGAGSFAPQAIAVNIDPAEEDLTPIDPAELVAAVTGHASATPASALPTGAEAEQIDIKDAERRQSFWWYLLVAGLLLLAAETVVSNQLSHGEKFL